MPRGRISTNGQLFREHLLQTGCGVTSVEDGALSVAEIWTSPALRAQIIAGQMQPARALRARRTMFFLSGAKCTVAGTHRL